MFITSRIRILAVLFLISAVNCQNYSQDDLNYDETGVTPPPPETAIIMPTTTINSLADMHDTPNESIGDKLRNASYEIICLSPLAWAIVIVPLITLFIFCTLIIYMCCCRKFKQKHRCRYDSNNLVNVNVNGKKEVKAPLGQPAPIPLTGLVNQPNGQGLKLLPKHNHHYQQHPIQTNCNKL